LLKFDGSAIKSDAIHTNIDIKVPKLV